ncbi:MAG: Hpt domain-containing protein [Gammaproteobacteria bacterium]|nr:Hpt domain-containing protein [Gammaproteobacteria bacterium]
MVERSEPGELEAKLAVIKRAYVAELPARAASLQAAWDRVQAEDWALAPLQELHRLAHTLAGSGATFGFADVSACARALEIPVKALLQDASPEHIQEYIQGEYIQGERPALSKLYEALLSALAAVAESGA